MKQENPISLRVPPTLRAKLDRAARAARMTRHAFILRTLWRAVDVPEATKPAPRASREVVSRPKKPKGGK